jgi:hypothetical protein
MGVCYTVILQDDFNWNYDCADKHLAFHKLKKAFNKIGSRPEMIAEWYGYMVIDFDKTFIPEYERMILKCCDSAYYFTDLDPGIMVEIARNKPRS